MSFLFISKTLRLNNLKTRAAKNENILVFVICIEAIIYWLLYNFHDCTFTLKSVTEKCTTGNRDGIGNMSLLLLKGAATDLRCFTRSKISRRLVHMENFSLIWQAAFKLGYLFWSRDVGYHFWVWMKSEKSHKWQ